MRFVITGPSLSLFSYLSFTTIYQNASPFKAGRNAIVLNSLPLEVGATPTPSETVSQLNKTVIPGEQNPVSSTGQASGARPGIQEASGKSIHHGPRLASRSAGFGWDDELQRSLSRGTRSFGCLTKDAPRLVGAKWRSRFNGGAGCSTNIVFIHRICLRASTTD